MGILFRDSRTHKYVRLGKRTVKDGEALAVWNERGEHRQFVGPCLVRLWMSTIHFLDRFIAGPNEYLLVTGKDGRIEHVKGPVAMFCDPIRHKKIQVRQAKVLASLNECLVVYTKRKSTDVPSASVVPASRTKGSALVPVKSKQLESKENEIAGTTITASDKVDGSSVFRRVVNGPAIFVPRVDEWTHDFRWTDLKTKTPHKFSVLQTGTRRFDTHVNMRTADAVLLTAYLSIQFRVTDVPAVVEACEDPIAVLQSLLSSDVSEFGTRIRSDDMLTSESRNNITVRLGKLDTYQQLIHGAHHMGLQIVGLCLMKLEDSPELQRQYDRAISTKTKMASARAAADQKQQIADLELSNQKRRMESEQALAAAKLSHKLKLEHNERKQVCDHQRQSNEEVLRFLKELRGMDVDLTSYLVSFAGQKATIEHLRKAGPLKHLTMPPIANPVTTPTALPGSGFP